MHRHANFDLYLHEDDELGAMLGSTISQRQVLQEWLLSCVQHIATSDGRKLIYKVQHDPTVEPEFFANAKSELLVSAQTVFKSGAYSAMLIEYIEGPTLSKMNPLPESLAVEIGGEILRRIAQIEGQLPYYLDVSALEKWHDWMYKVLSDLRGLVVTGAFQLVQAEELIRLESLAFSDEVLATFHTRIGYVHHDLAGDNVFVLPDGLKVIDWQRPILGPTSLDLALLLESLDFDPLPHVGEGVVRLMRLLRAGWFTECAARWFPEGRQTYDRQIAELIKKADSI